MRNSASCGHREGEHTTHLRRAASGYDAGVKLFPYGHVAIRTSLEPHEVERRLTAVVDTRSKPDAPPWLSFWGRLGHDRISARYVGGVGGLRRIQPVFEGRTVGMPVGSELRLRVRVHVLGALILCVWFGFFFLMAWDALHDGLTGGWGPRPHHGRGNIDSPRDALIIAGCFIVGGYAALVVQFWAEVRRGLAVLKRAVNS